MSNIPKLSNTLKLSWIAFLGQIDPTHQKLGHTKNEMMIWAFFILKVRMQKWQFVHDLTQVELTHCNPTKIGCIGQPLTMVGEAPIL